MRTPSQSERASATATPTHISEGKRSSTSSNAVPSTLRSVSADGDLTGETVDASRLHHQLPRSSANGANALGSETHIMSSSLDQLNETLLGQGPLFTENSTVNLPEFHLEEALDDLGERLSPSGKGQNICVDTIDASQSDDELVRQNTTLTSTHDKSD